VCSSSFFRLTVFQAFIGIHIPVVVGAQIRYEVTGDPLYKVNILASHVCLRVEMLYFIHVEAPIMGCVLKYMTY
jgi:hypothetical protein